MPHNKPLPEQFWSHVSPGAADACWEWASSRRPTGYGQLRRLGKNLKAHRVSWELHFGAIPEGAVVMHRCDNPPCVNPYHLVLGTQEANLADMRAKARATIPRRRGEANPASKLAAADVLRLRDMALGGASVRGLSREFGIDRKTVQGIVRRETWRHL